MPKEIKSKRKILDAVKSIPGLSDLLSMEEGHYRYEIDLEVMVYGRNYGGKKVGPYLRLLEYEPGETIMNEGDWGGNTFFYAVNSGVDVYVNLPQGGFTKVKSIPEGMQFGEMSILAGVPRSATLRAPSERKAQVLEVQRPALRLLRKIPAVNQELDRAYRTHGKQAVFSELRRITNLTPEWLDILSTVSRFRVFAKNHILFREMTPLNRIYIVKSGWMRRYTEAGEEDVLGRGHCFGLEGLAQDYSWPYSLTFIDRAELLEISIQKARKNPDLCTVIRQQLEHLMAPQLGFSLTQAPAVAPVVLAAQKELTETGLASATNLLVMDMALCVRCGNCSLACHKVHGHSRLLREGIHVNRMLRPNPGATQSVLSPAVCMHCKDPECMTGCPTGAIGRFEQGQVDIFAKTCIGCGDCATQCPYNAISLVPRRKKEEPGSAGLGAVARDLFRIRLDPLPPAVEQTEDLLAVKCNLCAGTTLNPEGSNKPAYSCEENCPTGALLRVDPNEYFSEVGNVRGLAFRSPTQAYGTNIHLADPTRRLMHTSGLILTFLLAALTFAGLHFFGLGGKLFWFLNMRWITGLAGLVAIIGVMLYPARRRRYTKRSGPLRYWLLSHTYLGIIGTFLIFIHGGTDTGGLLTTSLMISFDLVVFTGIFGIFCYYFIPKLLITIEDDPLLIDSLLTRRKELQEEIGKKAASVSPSLSDLVQKQILPRFLSLGFLLRQYWKRESIDSLLKESLEGRQESGVDEEDSNALEEIIRSCVLLRRVDSLIYLHRLLKAWLPPHVITTSLMLALMMVHIVQVIYFAWR